MNETLLEPRTLEGHTGAGEDGGRGAPYRVVAGDGLEGHFFRDAGSDDPSLRPMKTLPLPPRAHPDAFVTATSRAASSTS